MLWRRGRTIIICMCALAVVVFLYLRGSISLYNGVEDSSWSRHGTRITSFTPQASGSGYTRHIVVAKTTHENSSWLASKRLNNAVPMVYLVDDLAATLHVPKNKGREAMVYLTYLIDNYDHLPDIAIFMHAHQNAWHQDSLLRYDAIETVNRLSTEAVLREGYRNLRCEWNPGCPAHIRPKDFKADTPNLEEPMMARVWTELFPDVAIPDVIAQPCCAQFALSKEKMLSIPKSRYEYYRDWILKTDIHDAITGRIFEYLWQYIFTNQTVFCPDMYKCYCDGYNICFENEDKMEDWFHMRWQQRDKITQLTAWQRKFEAYKEYYEDRDEGPDDANGPEAPVNGMDVELYTEIDRLLQAMYEGRLEAIAHGEMLASRG